MVLQHFTPSAFTQITIIKSIQHVFSQFYKPSQQSAFTHVYIFKNPDIILQNRHLVTKNQLSPPTDKFYKYQHIKFWI